MPQAACRKGNQCSLRENLLFLSHDDFGNLNFHQCKYKFLCSAPRLIGTMCSACLVTLPHPVSSWPQEGSQCELTLVLEALPQAGELEQGIAREAKGALQC